TSAWRETGSSGQRPRGFPGELALQPHARDAPGADHAGLGDGEDARGLLDREPREETQLDHPGELPVQGREARQGLVEGDEIGTFAPHAIEELAGELQADALARVALAGGAAPRVVDEDAAHRLRRDAQEVRAPLEAPPGVLV